MNKYISYIIISLLSLIYLFFISSKLVVFTNIDPLLFNIISTIIIFLLLDIINKLYIKKYQLNTLELSFIYTTYFAILIYLLFFKNNQIIDSSTLDLIPLFFYSPSTLQYQLMIGNIIMFIPIGFLFKKYIKLPISLIFIILLSLAIEGTQFILKVGVFDLSDILLYFIGFYIGYCYFMLIKKLSIKYDNLSYDTSLLFNLLFISIIISIFSYYFIFTK